MEKSKREPYISRMLVHNSNEEWAIPKMTKDRKG